MSRLIYLTPEALNTCGHWAAVTGPEHITAELLNSTKALLANLSTQPDQTTILNNALDENIEATEAIRQLRAQVATLEATNTSLNTAVTNLTAAVTAVHGPRREEIPRPKEFDGTRSQLQAFIMQLRLHTATFTDEQAKLRLAVNCLTGDALDQARIYVQNDRVNLANLAAFITVMENAFGNPNRVAEAEYKLKTITQGSREFSAYHAEFQRYANEVTWDEVSKWSALRSGLSYELRKALILVRPPPATMAEFIGVCHDVDTQTRQLKSEGHRQQPQ